MAINNKETDISSVQSINIENSDKVSKSTKKDIKDKTKKNNDDVKDSKPKLVIVIPLPFALGYITINLGLFFGNLLKGLSVAVLALVMAKIAELLTEFLLDKLKPDLSDIDNIKAPSVSITNSDIEKGLKSININSLIKEAENELKTTSQQSVSVDANSFTDTQSTGDATVIKPHPNTKRINNNKNKYSIDKRNRKDELESDIVSDRKGTNNKKIRTINNPNYGVYYD